MLVTEDLRKAVLAEADTWVGTKFHHQGRVKGAGVDCLMFLAEVYERAGVTDHIEVGYYPQAWHLHQSEERYLDGVLQYAMEIPNDPKPADVALFRFGRCFSHAAIVVAWPRVIHALWNRGMVCYGSADQYPLGGRPVKFFDVISAKA